ncbi:MAG: hypothetical protein HGA31_02685 [Candidatus Moranbacteria bacterium]|nr:hypothetical protein [Candidatus Moranbacteria bacterium]
MEFSSIKKHIKTIEEKIDSMSSEEEGNLFSMMLAVTAVFAIAYKLVS